MQNITLNEPAKEKNKIGVNVYFFVLILLTGFVNKFQYGGGISSQIPFIFGFVVVSFFKYYSDKKIHIEFSDLWMLLYWYILAISTLKSKHVSVERDTLTFLISTILFIFSTGIIYNKKEIRLILAGYIFTAFITANSIIYNFYIGNDFLWKRYTATFYGVDKDPNYASAFMLPAISLLFYKMLSKKNKIKKTEILLLLIISLGVLLTNSRMGFLFLSFIYIYSFFLFVWGREIKMNRKLLVVILCLFFIFTLVKNYDYLLSKTTFTRVISFSNYSDNLRLNVWGYSLDLLKSNFALGLGYGGVNKYLLSSYSIVSHNVFIDILTSTGVIGAIVLLGILIRFCDVKKQDKLYILGIMISFFGPLFFINGFNTSMFWTPMMIMGILSKYSKRNVNNINLYSEK